MASPDDSNILDQIIADYLAAIDRGEQPSREKLKADNPTIADRLQEFYDDLDQMPAANKETDASPMQAAKSEMIGPYKLLQQIGEGGMGEVWMAEQQHPIVRRVALKLIKTGLDRKQIVARFEAERQALAMMNHQNIAKVLDAGTTDSGVPYFVMELVQGIPITEYCDRHQLSIEERLKLFTPVCNAVQHAHQKGIIHRDLKPSNILVTLYDGVPVPKVIDFGLAKALQHHSKLTDKTLFTEFGQVVGTLQYLSPEQAEMNALDIDTRSDIYSLGVLLYELLTGSTPIESETLKQQAMLQVLQTIREQDPPRPSVRLSSSGNAIPGISKHRSIDPKQLSQILKGDLDWIVMKALEIDRTRRFDTANSFADDIQRYLDGDAVEARPPSTIYRVRKTIRKHRGTVAASVAILSLLVLGIIGSTWGLVRARQAERAAENSAQVANTSERQAINAMQAVAAERDAKASVVQALERQNYRSGLQNAMRLIQAGELDAANRTLLELPESLRGWEWSCLINEANPHFTKTNLPDDVEILTDLGSDTLVTTTSGDFAIVSVAGSKDELKVFRTSDGSTGHSIALSGSQQILSCSVSDGADRVAVLYATEIDSEKGLACSIALWDRRKNGVIWTRESLYTQSNDLLGNLVLAPNGLCLVAYGVEGTLAKSAKVFDRKSFAFVFKLAGSDQAKILVSEEKLRRPSYNGSFSADSRYFISNSFSRPDYDIFVVDVTTLETRSGEELFSHVVSRDAWSVFGTGSEIAVQKSFREWRVCDLTDGSELATLTGQIYEAPIIYDSGECCCVNNGRLGLRFYNSGSSSVFWNLASVPKFTVAKVDEKERNVLLFTPTTVVRYPLPNASQILHMSRMTADNWDSFEAIDQPDRSIISAEKLGGRIVPLGSFEQNEYFDGLDRGKHHHRVLRDIETTELGGFLRTSDAWTQQGNRVCQLRLSDDNHSNPLVTVSQLFPFTAKSEYQFEVNFERFGTPRPLLASDGKSILLVAEHINRENRPDIVWCRFGEPQPINRFTASVNVDSTVDFDGEFLWIISDGELMRISVLTATVSACGVFADCAKVSPDGKEIAIGKGASASILGFPELNPITAISVSALCRNVHWFAHQKRLFVECSNSLECVDTESGEVLMRFPNRYASNTTFVPQTGETILLSDRYFSSIPFRERWEYIQRAGREESSRDARFRATEYFLEKVRQNPDLSLENILVDGELSMIERKIAGNFFVVAKEVIDALDDPVLDRSVALSLIQNKVREIGYGELEEVLPYLMSNWRASPGAYQKAGHKLALEGQWAEAAAAWNEVINQKADEPSATMIRTFIAPMHLAVGDVDSYQTVCQEIMEHADSVEYPSSIFFLVLTCCSEENDPELEQRVLDYAKIKLKESPDPTAPLALGAAYYRTGDLENARAILNKLYTGMVFAPFDKQLSLDAGTKNQLNVMTSVCAIFLAATYRDSGELEKIEPILRHIRKLVDKLESTNPQEGGLLTPWANKFTVLNLKRELAKFEASGLPGDE